MSVTNGSWTLQFSWGCTGSYSSGNKTFNPDGTWSGSGGSGRWSEEAGMLMWNFDSAPAVYAGNLAGGSMTGTMATFSGSKGCWYAIQSTTTTRALAEGEYNEDGSKQN